MTLSLYTLFMLAALWCFASFYLGAVWAIWHCQVGTRQSMQFGIVVRVRLKMFGLVIAEKHMREVPKR